MIMPSFKTILRFSPKIDDSWSSQQLCKHSVISENGKFESNRENKIISSKISKFHYIRYNALPMNLPQYTITTKNASNKCQLCQNPIQNFPEKSPEEKVK